MRVFCTNDDGIYSVGLEQLAARLGEIAEVVVGAPDRNMSGTGTAVHTAGTGAIRVTPHVYEENPQVEAYAVTGTPALTAILAYRETFGGPYDLVVSGPNFGANAGWDIHHSGTVGAALTAVKYGMHGLAVSLAVGAPWGAANRDYGSQPYESIYGAKDAEAAHAANHDPHWETAAEVGSAVAAALGEASLAYPVLLNVNVPNVPLERLAGLRTVHLAGGSPMHFSGFHEATEADGTRVLTPQFGPADHPVDLETDIGALIAGFATVSWLTLPGSTEPAVDGLEAALAEAVGRLG